MESPAVVARAVEAAGHRSSIVRDSAEAPSAPGNGWLAQQADALVAVARAYLADGVDGSRSSSDADHYQVVVHVDEAALRGGAGRSDLPLETVRRRAATAA